MRGKVSDLSVLAEWGLGSRERQSMQKRSKLYTWPGLSFLASHSVSNTAQLLDTDGPKLEPEGKECVFPMDCCWATCP